MVGDLAALGLHKVRGALVVDDSLFDGGYVPPGLRPEERLDASRAPSSAASLNGNVVAVTIIPGATAGAPARIVLDPPSPYFTVAGRVVTAASGPAAPAVDTKEDGGHTRVNVGGRIKLGADPRTFYRRVAQPSLFLGLHAEAAARAARDRRRRRVRVGAAPAQGLRVLAAHDSAPLAVVVQDLNKRSNNFAAEQLLRTMGAEIGGRPGNWDKGLEGGRPLPRPASESRPAAYQMTERLGPLRLEPLLGRADRHDPARRGARLPHLGRVPGVAGGRRHRRHHRPPHGRHAGRALRPRQDRHAGDGQLPVRLRRLAGPRCRSCSRSW